jgi:uncharacterized protein
MARIALDIDSTLHHYWDLFEQLAERRYGIPLPYSEQTDWDIATLEAEQVLALISESHSDENILAAEPYPHAPETIRRWHAEGHWIHITSHRSERAREATARWLDRAGIPYDDLHCSYDKIPRCVAVGIDVLVDDSPANLIEAAEHGIAGATIIHPWNADLVQSDAIIGARDWRELGDLLRPLLDR